MSTATREVIPEPATEPVRQGRPDHQPRWLAIRVARSKHFAAPGVAKYWQLGAAWSVWRSALPEEG